MNSIKLLIFIVSLFFGGEVFANANPSRSIANLTGDSFGDFTSDEYLSNRQSLEV